MGSRTCGKLRASVNPCSSSFDLTVLLDELFATHHQVLRRAVRRIAALAADNHVHDEIAQVANSLAACCESQLDREENVLFPMLQRLAQTTSISACRAGMIRARVMIAERELARVRGTLQRLRELAEQHLSPAGPCEACHELLLVINPLMSDLREHTRKKCDLLFPWAIEREQALIQ